MYHLLDPFLLLSSSFPFAHVRALTNVFGEGNRYLPRILCFHTVFFTSLFTFMTSSLEDVPPFTVTYYWIFKVIYFFPIYDIFFLFRLMEVYLRSECKCDLYFFLLKDLPRNGVVAGKKKNKRKWICNVLLKDFRFEHGFPLFSF